MARVEITITLDNEEIEQYLVRLESIVSQLTSGRELYNDKPMVNITGDNDGHDRSRKRRA